MTSDDKPWQARVMLGAGRTRVLQRNRPAVLGWTTATLAALSAGLLSDLSARPWWLTFGCYGAAAVFGVVLFAYLFAKRLYVAYPQDR